MPIPIMYISFFLIFLEGTIDKATIGGYNKEKTKGAEKC